MDDSHTTLCVLSLDAAGAPPIPVRLATGQPSIEVTLYWLPQPAVVLQVGDQLRVCGFYITAFLLERRRDGTRFLFRITA